MTLTIDLLRHGDVAGGTKLLGHYDEPLTELGWQQLRSVVDGREPPWTKIITSPLQRCHSFAHELHERFGLALTVDERFREIGFGEWEGRLFSDLYAGEDKERIMQFWRNPLENPAPSGEPYAEFEGRVFSAWEELLGQYVPDQEQHVLLVAHGGVIRAILRHLLQFPIEHFFRIDVPYASLSRVRQEMPDFPRLIFHSGCL